MTTALERLEELLDEKDAQIAELESQNRSLKLQHDNELNGLLDHDEIPDDETLPIPRLEVVYLKDEEVGWRDTRVVYRMVYRHLTGSLQSVPLGVTRMRSGLDAEPAPGRQPGRRFGTREAARAEAQRRADWLRQTT